MPKSSNLTPSQAAAVLAISGSTLRRWSTDYTRHLSESARGEGGRHQSYTPDDLALLKHAGELLKTHAPGEVDQLLGLADETQQSAALATLPTVAALMGQLADRVAALEDQHEADRAEVDRLRGEVGALADRQRKARDRQQAALDDLRAEVAALKTPRHWWQRWRSG